MYCYGSVIASVVGRFSRTNTAPNTTKLLVLHPFWGLLSTEVKRVCQLKINVLRDSCQHGMRQLRLTTRDHHPLTSTAKSCCWPQQRDSYSEVGGPGRYVNAIKTRLPSSISFPFKYHSCLLQHLSSSTLALPQLSSQMQPPQQQTQGYNKQASKQQTRTWRAAGSCQFHCGRHHSRLGPCCLCTVTSCLWCHMQRRQQQQVRLVQQLHGRSPMAKIGICVH